LGPSLSTYINASLTMSSFIPLYQTVSYSSCGILFLPNCNRSYVQIFTFSTVLCFTRLSPDKLLTQDYTGIYIQTPGIKKIFFSTFPTPPPSHPLLPPSEWSWRIIVDVDFF
jgi:hypothetical protein